MVRVKQIRVRVIVQASEWVYRRYRRPHSLLVSQLVLMDYRRHRRHRRYRRPHSLLVRQLVLMDYRRHRRYRRRR